MSPRKLDLSRFSAETSRECVTLPRQRVTEGAAPIKDERLVFGTDGTVRLRSAARDHDQDPDAWSTDLVRERLEEAFRLVNRTGGRVGPAGYGTTMPAYVHEWGDLIGQAEEGTLHEGGNRIRLGATAADVSAMERTLDWRMTYLVNHPKALHWLDRHLDWIAAGKRDRRNRRCTFSEIVKADGSASLASAKRWRNQALTLISLGLTQDGVKP